MRTKALLLAGVAGLLTAGLAQATTFGTEGSLHSFHSRSFGNDSLHRGESDDDDRNEQGHSGGNWGHHHGHEHDGDDEHEHEHVPGVPEPGTWAMMIVGAGLMAYQLRRKQRTLGSRAA